MDEILECVAVHHHGFFPHGGVGFVHCVGFGCNFICQADVVDAYFGPGSSFRGKFGQVGEVCFYVAFVVELRAASVPEAESESYDAFFFFCSRADCDVFHGA